jgi:hypothetical protein
VKSSTSASGIRTGVFDKLEPVSSQRVFEQISHGALLSVKKISGAAKA